MALTSGERLAHYEVDALIGQGGMGAVYRARDTKLDRDVAIKVLPEELSRDSERMARFEREAKLLAALNHSNIATIHGLDASDGRQFLIMELVEGETLAERIARGPIPLDEAIALFTQIAEGLEAAHEKGILHRDLKPANIKIAPDGKIKILDFGLAKALAGEDAALEASDSPTLTKGTSLGAILGTAAYMSPEQARGKALDKRTDVWAFGCCLFEALTGTKAFAGDTVSDTIAAVLKGEPRWERLPAGTPPLIRTLLRQCLEKDPHRRLHDVADARVLLSAAPVETTAEPRERRMPVWMLATGALLAAALGAILSYPMKADSPVDVRPARFRIDTSRAQAVLPLSGSRSFELSQNGRVVVYSGRGSGFRANGPLFIRHLDAWSVEPILGTEGARAPFLSPDGEWVAYTLSGQLMKIRTSGGRAVSLGAFSVPRGAHWSADGWIYLQQYTKGTMRIPEDGGEPETVLAPDPEKGEKTVRHPFVLPGGRAVLVTTGYATMRSYDEATIEVYELETGVRKVLVEGGTSARYTSSAHLVFARNGSLLAAPFDADRLELLAQPTTVLEGVLTSHGFGVAEFDVADNGTLAYLPGSPELYHSRLFWVDANGTMEPFEAEGRNIANFQFSPDGRRLALHEASGNDTIWVYELDRGTWVRITSAWDNTAPVWTKDGSKLIYGSVRADGEYKMSRNADGSGAEDQVAAVSSFGHDLTPDGEALVYSDGTSVWSASMVDSGEPEPIFTSDVGISGLAISPNGSWVAYNSNDSGRPEIYVSPFPSFEARLPISTGGGSAPRWSADGRTLFFVTEEGISSVEIRMEGELRVSSPRHVVQLPGVRNFDVSPQDGRLLVVQENIDELPTDIHVVLNWTEELKRLVPIPN